MNQRWAVAMAVTLSFASFESEAYLGGFEAQDGYFATVFDMVNSYNAGQYGTTNGGPGGVQVHTTSPVFDAPGGLWKDLNGSGSYTILPAGGRYVTAHPVLGSIFLSHTGTAA